jgi:thiamine kinase-like enzyme
MAQAAARASPDQRLAQPTAAALARVPGLEGGELPLQVLPLEGGTVNQLWRVDTRVGRFVVRIDGPQARRPGVDRAREFLLHTQAAAARLAPAIIAGDANSGIMISEFIDGRRWEASDCLDRSALHRLGERLSRLHQLTARTAPFEPLRIAEAYVSAAPALGEELAGTVTGLVGAVAAAQQRFAEDPAGRVIIHGDLNHLNLIDAQPLWLIDWEYAQVADPLLDLGCLLAYYPGAQAHSGELLAAAGLGAHAQRGRLAAATFLYQAMSWLWHVARGEPPPGAVPQLD